ncbi:MAG: hypothetical protein AB7T37_01230 [Dehalococcoidia bacterium]
MGTTETETAIKQRPEALLLSFRPERRLVIELEWWQSRVLGWAMADRDFRVQLLRFVDVLPAPSTAMVIADHVYQYFGAQAPAKVRAAISLTSRSWSGAAAGRCVTGSPWAWPGVPGSKFFPTATTVVSVRAAFGSGVRSTGWPTRRASPNSRAAETGRSRGGNLCPGQHH